MPPYIPYALLQHLCQAPAVIRQLQAETEAARSGSSAAAGGAERLVPGGGVHWTARLWGARGGVAPGGAGPSSSCGTAVEGVTYICRTSCEA